MSAPRRKLPPGLRAARQHTPSNRAQPSGPKRRATASRSAALDKVIVRPGPARCVTCRRTLQLVIVYQGRPYGRDCAIAVGAPSGSDPTSPRPTPSPT